MRAVLTVIGKDRVGILAMVSSKCAECGANVTEVTQTVMQDLFCMIMMVDTAKLTCELSELIYQMQELGAKEQLTIHVMHEDVFNSMHRI